VPAKSELPRAWAGVDGCPAGWVLAVIDDAGLVAELRVVRSFAEIAVQAPAVKLTLADIPIGLPSAGWPRDRTCDSMARRWLGPRAASVFPVPSREAVWSNTYAEAARRNREILGRSLSLQSWNICPKIREVDAVMRLSPALQASIRETHPELCFRLMNNHRPLETPKKSAAGRRIRRELLRGWTTHLDTALVQARPAIPAAQAGLDDLLDALAAAVVARLVTEDQVRSFPLAPEYDAAGLRMEIVGYE
jgi:predicted RNase H-like nuclease